MREKGFEELAAEVVTELGASIRGFRIDKIDSSEREGMTIHGSWTLPSRISLSVHLRGNESNESIKAEIRRQLEPLLGETADKNSQRKATRVLLVDDDVLFVRIISAALVPFEVAVEAALSAESALALLRQKKFDALVTDLHMQQMSGVDLVEHVLMEGLVDASRILVLTGERDAREIQRARLRGVRVLHKPVTATDLEEALRKIV